jgi:hypothetical protein
LTSILDSARVDVRHKAGWRVVRVIEGIGYIVVRYEKPGTADFDVILDPTGIAKLNSSIPVEYMKMISDDIGKTGTVRPTFILPPVKTEEEKQSRDVAIGVVKKYFGDISIRINTK